VRVATKRNKVKHDSALSPQQDAAKRSTIDKVVVRVCLLDGFAKE
jgi:hypothetical protein